MYQKMSDTYAVYDIAELLEGNKYPGRGIIIGNTPKETVIAYFIMGRSENSRNRHFVDKGDHLIAEALDPSKVKDPSLIIYSPLREVRDPDGSGLRAVIVTNGDQTDTVSDRVAKDGNQALTTSFQLALETREFEPDAPNFTPRISGIADLETRRYRMSILKAGDPEGGTCSRYFFDYEMQDNIGRFIHTYEEDGSPVPTFVGEPDRVTISGGIDDFTEEVWNALDPDNRISLYVRYIDNETKDFETRLVNKYSL